MSAPAGLTGAAFYLPEGADFLATELTRGPWDPAAQHGGPPAALLAAELERRHPREGVRLARITVEIVRPVPLGRLSVHTRVVRPGRNVELLEGTLCAGDREVLRSTAWRIAVADPAEAPTVDPPPVVDPGPTQARELEFFPTGHEVGYHTAMEARFVEGSFLDPGPAVVWMRPRVPLVAGRTTSPWSLVLVAADSGNGVSGVLDYRDWMFINTELTVHLVREPVGEWVRLEARTTVSGDGMGLADTALHDELGPIGRGSQSLYVARRRN